MAFAFSAPNPDAGEFWGFNKVPSHWAGKGLNVAISFEGTRRTGRVKALRLDEADLRSRFCTQLDIEQLNLTTTHSAQNKEIARNLTLPLIKWP